MNEVLMAKLTRAADNVRDGGRTLTLLGVIWCGTQIAEVKQRIATVEARLIYGAKKEERAAESKNVRSEMPESRDDYRLHDVKLGRKSHDDARP